MFEWLERTNKLDDTAMILSSDHGFFLGEWRLYDKRFMHEPSIRIPMMVRYPKRVKPGTVRDDMVLDLDIAPTILDIAGVKIPEKMSGASMLKLTTDKTVTDWRKDWLYHYYEYPKPSFVQPHYGIRTDRYKLIFYHELKAYEMYDLQQDPGELNNLADKPEMKSIQEQLWNRLVALRKELGDTRAPATA
jgi:arylsulfatase A-like enzyme